MKRGSKRAAAAGAVAMITLATLGATGAPEVEAASNQPPGINSSAALDNPNCDADLEQVILKYYPVPCVVEWDGGDNGGKTAPGVSADAIKVLVYAAQPVDQPSTSATDLTRNLASGLKGNVRDAVFDVNAVFQNLETWGREIEFDFLVQTGTDEAARKADAVSALSMDPFLVLDLAGSEVFATEMAARKRMVISVSGTNEASAAQKPYRFSTSIDYRAMAVLIPELIAKGLMDRDAEWAGSDEFQKQERTFGVVYSAGNAGLDIDQYNQALATWKAPKSAVELSFESPVAGGTEAVTAAAQQAAPTMIARLKEQGVTSVVLFTTSTLITPLLEQATSQDYHPEWITTGYGFQDLDILARNFDQEQFSHAFGLGVIRPAVLAGRERRRARVPVVLGPRHRYVQRAAARRAVRAPRGVHLAGPNLTASVCTTRCSRCRPWVARSTTRSS